MCGIAGYVSVPSCDRETLRRMAKVIAHRGPDDESFWTDPPVGLGYRRLAIIDLSPLGNQPIISRCGRYVMIYNGEIYNYVELRGELEASGDSFRGSSDSEVLIAAYARWGVAALARLNGMWAFAIWDREARRLFASRDRFGKKPFYFQRLGDGLLFASEMKALFSTGLVTARPDLKSVADFAAERVVDHRAGTFFLGVEQLEPGHNLTWERGRTDIRRYWRPDPAPIERIAAPASPESFAEDLKDAVRVRLRADTPLGVLLSGGVDSSAVACIATLQSTVGMSSFSTIDPLDPPDEAEGVKLVSERFPQLRAHVDRPDAEAFVADLERCLWHQEEPFADGSMVAHFRLMRIAREAGVKVVLTGQGADETVAGYPAFIAIHLASLLRKGEIGAFARFMAAFARSGQSVPVASAFGYALPRTLRAAVRSRLMASQVDWLVPEARNVSARVARGLAFHERESLHGAMIDCIRARTLPGFLHYEDRNSMAHGVETRLPFLDVRLAESTLNTPASVLLRAAKTKALLRESMQGIVPAAILERLSKQGYPAPIGRWLRQATAERWSDWLTAVERCPLIVASRWRAHKDRFLAGEDHRLAPVWRGLILALWYRRFVSPT